MRNTLLHINVPNLFQKDLRELLASRERYITRHVIL